MANPLDSEPELLPFVDPETQRLFRDHALSGDDEQWLLAEFRAQLATWRANLPKPTREQVLQVTHEENRIHASLNGGNQQFWDGLEADWRRKQKPDSPQWDVPNESPPQGDSTPDHRTEDPKSSTRPSLDDFWKPIDAINQAAQGAPISDPKLPVKPPPKSKPETLADDPTQTGAEIMASSKSWFRRAWEDEIKPLFKRTPIWIKWALGLFLFGLTMIQIGEYLLALLSFVAAGAFFIVWILTWDGWSHKRKLTKAVKAALLVVVVAGFAMFALIAVTIKGQASWSHLTRFLHRTPASIQSKNLHDYFTEEGFNCLRKRLTQVVVLENNQQINAEAQMCMDFNGKAEHLAFYIPETDYTADVASQLIATYQGTVNLFIQTYQGKIEVGPIEGRKTQVKDLRFTRYIVIFHEVSIPQDKLDEVDAQANQLGLILEHHSQEFVLARMPK